MCLIAIQGILGSYSEEAVQRMYDGKASILECLNFDETFQAVVDKKADFAVVPLKNNIVGQIKSASAVLKMHDLKILEELPLEIQHVLIGTRDGRFENLQTVVSHEEALKQCRKFLSENASLQANVGRDTASCVKKVVEENDSVRAAIGSRRAAEIYGGKILKENIADEAENVTTFYLIGN